MIEIRSGCVKCSLTAILVACTFFVGSGARPNRGSSGAFASASAYAGASATAGASALSSAAAFGEIGDSSGVYDGHKGTRSYDGTGFLRDNVDRGAKSYGIAGHGAGGDGIKGSDHGYNKNDCSKCKWENDDYWERDEPEEEGDEKDGDECDDGQYKPNEARHRGAGGPVRGHKQGSHPSGVLKTGPTGVYIDDEPEGKPVGPHGGVGYSVPTTGYAAPTGFPTGSTPKPGFGWNAPFPATSKPGYAGATAGAYGTTSSSQPDWSRGITPSGFTSSKPTWGGTGPAGNFATTPKPGTSWEPGAPPTGEQPSSRKPWNIGHDVAPVASTPRPGQGWNTGFDHTPATDLSQKPAPNWSTDQGPFSQRPGGSPWPAGHDGASFGTTLKPGRSWNAPPGGKPEPSWNSGYGTASTGTSNCPRPDSSCTQGKQGPVKLGATPVDIDRTEGGESPSSISSAVPQIGSGASSPDTYGRPKENQNWLYGQPGIQSTYAGASVTSGNIPQGTPNFERKDNPFFNKPAGTQTSYHAIDQAHPTGGAYGPEGISDYNKPVPGRGNTWPSNVANTFETTKRPYGGINLSGTGAQSNTLSPGQLPGSPIGSGITNSWLSTGQPASGSNILHRPDPTGAHAGFPVSPTGFGTTKSPFSRTNIPGPAPLGSSYSGTGLKQPSFNAASSIASASAGASAGASAFGIFPGMYSTTYTIGTTPAYKGVSSYPAVNSPGSAGPTYGIAPHGTYSDAGTNAWPSKRPGSETTFGGHPGTINDNSSGKQPGSNNPPWSSAKPGDESKVTPGKYPGTASDIWRGRQPSSVSGVRPIEQPGSERGFNVKPEDGSRLPFDNYPGIGIEPNRQSLGGSGAWPSKQPEDERGTWPAVQRPVPACSGINCGDTIPNRGSNNCVGGNYNCKGSCTGRDNAQVTYGPCDETVNGPSGVNKTYYPAGTGDGHVPYIGNAYESSLPFNDNVGAYPGPGPNIPCKRGDISCNQGASITPDESVRWNSANPFLFGTGGGTPSSVSRPWNSGTTAKPIGQGNPFLDSNWSGPKPAYSNSNANNDGNVIPHGTGNTKPIGRGNPFLDENKRRQGTEVNPNESVIPLGGRKPESYNPFLGSGNDDSNNPSYGQPDGYHPASSTPESGGVKGGPRGGVLPQREYSSGAYPTSGNLPGADPFRCKLGIFGCGTSGSGSYNPTTSGKYPAGVSGSIGGGVGIGDGNSGNVGSVPARPGESGVNRGAGYPPLMGSNLALSGAYAGSFSGAHTSHFANAKSLPSSDTAGSDNDFGQARDGSWSSSGPQNQGGSNSWASSSAFASSSSGSWSGNYPTNVKG